MLEEADPGTPESGLQRLGSVGAVLQSVIVPGGQVPPALAAVPPPELLAAPGPVVWAPGSAVGAGVGDVMPVVAEGLLTLPLGAALGLELGLDAPLLVLLLVPPDVPPDDVWALATADRPKSEAATRGKSLKLVMAGSRNGNDAD